MEKISKKFAILILKTQREREAALSRIKSLIVRAEKAIDTCKDEVLKKEWARLVGFLTQVQAALLKSYDEVRFNENLQEAEKLIEELKRKQEELEMRERELQIKEQELNRKIAALEKAEAEGGGGRV